jgi:hypothetical protein
MATAVRVRAPTWRSSLRGAVPFEGVDTAHTLTAAAVQDDELYFEDGEIPAAFAHPLVTPIEIRVSA